MIQPGILWVGDNVLAIAVARSGTLRISCYLCLVGPGCLTGGARDDTECLAGGVWGTRGTCFSCASIFVRATLFPKEDICSSSVTVRSGDRKKEWLHRHIVRNSRELL